MSIFNVIAAPGQPDSVQIADGVVFDRGIVGFIDTNGKLTTTISGTRLGGLVDDIKQTSLYAKVVDEAHTTDLTIASGGGVATTIALGRTIKDASADLFVTGGSCTIYTAPAATPTVFTAQTNVALWTVAITTTGTVDVTAAGTALTDGAYKLKVVLSYTYAIPVPQLGAETKLDIFSNDSTAGSATAVTGGMATLYFLDGKYETDQYDPYVAYTPGSPLYVQEGGILTTSTTSVYQEGGSNKSVGSVAIAPQAALGIDAQLTSGHSNPNPTALKLYWRP